LVGEAFLRACIEKRLLSELKPVSWQQHFSPYVKNWSLTQMCTKIEKKNRKGKYAKMLKWMWKFIIFENHVRECENKKKIAQKKRKWIWNSSVPK